MTHHIQFSYPCRFLPDELLKHFQTLFSKFSPDHIAVGILEGQSHVYIALDLPFRHDSYSKKLLYYQDTKPLLCKNVRSSVHFTKMFASAAEEDRKSILHYYHHRNTNSDTNNAPNISEIMTTVGYLLAHNEQLKQENPVLKEMILTTTKMEIMSSTQEPQAMIMTPQCAATEKGSLISGPTSISRLLEREEESTKRTTKANTQTIIQQDCNNNLEMTTIGHKIRKIVVVVLGSKKDRNERKRWKKNIGSSKKDNFKFLSSTAKSNSIRYFPRFSPKESQKTMRKIIRCNFAVDNAAKMCSGSENRVHCNILSYARWERGGEQREEKIVWFMVFFVKSNSCSGLNKLKIQYFNTVNQLKKILY